MKKIFAVILLCLPFFLYAQLPADTLSRYDEGCFLLKLPGRYELRNREGLIDWWENMNDYISLDNKTYHLIKRKEGDKWKTGLFRRKEGKLFLHPEYEQVSSFFGSSHLTVIKGDHDFFLYSIANGSKTRDGFQTFRQFGNDCLAFSEHGVFIYSNKLELKDSMIGCGQPINQLRSGRRRYLFLDCKEGKTLVDYQYQRSHHPDWKGIVRLEGNLMVVEGQNGHGVYHVGQNKLITSLNHKPYSYELHEERFILFKEGSYILYDTAGNIIVKVIADGMACVDDLKAFFYLQDKIWKIMSGAGKVLKTPDFDHFEQDKAPVGQFIARIKGEKKLNLYAWVYTEANGQKTIAGIKLLKEYTENRQSPSNWPPNQTVPAEK